MPRLSTIHVYPIKSLPGVQRLAEVVLPSGALQYDRRWALIDSQGKYVNAKRTSVVHWPDARYADDFQTVSLRQRQETAWQTFPLSTQSAELRTYLSAALHQPVELVENRDRGWPDDTDYPGPTVVSRASLELVAAWFPGLAVDEIARRFRVNLELDDCEPFWEDRLVAAQGGVPFQIGPVMFEGMNPCQRCPVPTQDSRTGEVWPGFAKQFAVEREATLPPWAIRERFNHFYRLSVNTRLVTDGGGRLRLGDEVT